LHEIFALTSNFKVLNTSAPLPVVPGLDVGFYASATSLSGVNIPAIFGAGTDLPEFLPFGGLYIGKGLPMGVDLIVQFVPNGLVQANFGSFGAGAKWRFMTLGLVDLAGGASYNSVTLDVYKTTNMGVFAQASLKMPVFKPYLGLNWMKADGEISDPTLPAGVDTAPSFTATGMYAGLKFSMLMFTVTGQVDISKRNTYSLKAAIEI
jgi:hypothetical protein